MTYVITCGARLRRYRSRRIRYLRCMNRVARRGDRCHLHVGQPA